MTSPKFEELYKKLNKKQKEAVDTIDGPVMVVAGPGTGKTTILTLRIANILKQTDTPPSGILAITFTDAGVKAMRQKLKEIIGARAHEVRIHTFHNFASAIIAEFKDHFVHLDRVTQLTDVMAETMIRTILHEEKFSDLRPFGNPDFYLTKIIGAISDCKRESFTPEMIRAFVHKKAEDVKKDEESYSTRGKTKGELKADVKKMLEKCERTLVFVDVYDLYEQKKREEKRMDFDDLIGELIRALKKDELLLRMIQEKFLYIMVDEHQDTNNSQNELVKMLADFFDTPNVFIVGDEKQAIYRFQGASVENFLMFENMWQGMRVVHLEDNYRSHQSILDAGFSMIENNYVEDEHQNLRVKLKAGNGESPRPVDVVKAEDVNASEQYLVKQIKAITEKSKDASVAIITKTNRDLERILRLLEAHEVPVSSQRSIDIFSHPVGSLFFDLAEFLYDTTKLDLFGKTLAAGLWGLSFDDAVVMIKSIRAGRELNFAEKIPVFAEIQKEINADSPLGFLVHLATKSGLENVIAREPSYIEVWRGIIALAESIVREGSVHDPRELLARLGAYRASSEMRSVKISVGTPDLQVQAMTAHGSKGLEFDYVFIPFATEESWIGRNWGNYFILPETRASNEVQDVRRLFYVALTRARKHATILFGLEEFGELLSPLRFIDELDAAHVSLISIPRSKVKKDLFIQKERKNRHADVYLAHAKRVLLDSGLSVTALNNFITCPSTFLFSSILKLPQAPAANAEKGNAMHDAFNRVWGLSEKTVDTIQKTIEESITHYFSESFLPVFEKEAVLKELLEDAPIVAKELAPHFRQSGTVFSETWSESTFSADISVTGESLKIPIHGKLDAVIDTEEKTLVFDYKTKQVMSENDIRGNTKNSDGNYFRQLAFYKLLLQDDSRFSKKEIIPSLVFAVPDKKGKCPIVTLPVEKTDIEKVQSEITGLLQSVWSGSVLTDFCDDKKCEWCRLKKVVLD